jgi:hypothetical protein
LFAASSDINPVAGSALAPGASMTCTGSYAALQADVNAGGTIDNTATASSTEAPDATGNASVPVSTTAAMTVTKSVTDVGGDGSTGSVDAEGDVIAYSVLVSNNGSVTLNNVTLADPLFEAAPVCSPTAPAILAPTESMTCTGSYTATQADVDGGGPIDNTATASSTDAPDATGSASVPVTTTSAITNVKSSGTALVIEVGQVVDYSFVITNIGNVTATNVVLTDAKLDAPAICSPIQGSDLAPAEVMSCTGSHVVTTTDVLLASLDNTATAESETTPPATDSYSIPIDVPVVESKPVPVQVPVNNPFALFWLILMLLATGWYFRPAGIRKF